MVGPKPVPAPNPILSEGPKEKDGAPKPYPNPPGAKPPAVGPVKEEVGPTNWSYDAEKTGLVKRKQIRQADKRIVISRASLLSNIFPPESLLKMNSK